MQGISEKNMTDSFEARGEFSPETNLDTEILGTPDFSDAPSGAETSLDAIAAEPNGFVKLGLAKELLQAVADMGFTQPTAVQLATIPKAMQALDAESADKKAKFTDLLVSARPVAAKQQLFCCPCCTLCSCSKSRLSVTSAQSLSA